MWKDFFYFTKRERQGIIVLIVLILGVCVATVLLSIYIACHDVEPNKDLTLEKEYNEFIGSLQEMKLNKRDAKDRRYAYSKQEIRLAPFDPNTADSLTFLSLGLPPWMAKNILRYRSKQGKFRQPEDFRRTYGLTEEQYQTLRPFIRIGATINAKDTTSLLSKHQERRDSLFKYQPGTTVELNQADTTELKKIPGIGSGIARMIVNYRNLLGGFYQVNQLKEIHLKVEKLYSWFTVNANQTERINLNKASLERMMHHPYINYYQAKVIVEYRKKKGKIKNLKQLSLYEEFGQEDFERIAPYVCFE